jgi:hypothetical protein
MTSVSGTDASDGTRDHQVRTVDWDLVSATLTVLEEDRKTYVLVLGTL